MEEDFATCTRLRRFLIEHPLLVLELGFRPFFDISQPYGFDVQPTDRWLREKQRTLQQPVLQALLVETIQALLEEIPGRGLIVAFDVTPMYAWVKENNWRAYVKERFNTDQQPKGDPESRSFPTLPHSEQLDPP